MKDNDIALLREAYIRDIGKILRPSDVTVARAAFDAGFAAALTPTKHDDATAEREASAGAIAAFNDAFDAYAQHMGDPDGRDDIHAATNAAALVIDAFAKPAPSEQARAEEVEADSSVYKRTFYGILNVDGQFWTPIAFDSEAKAQAHINVFFVDRYQLEEALKVLTIVPVRSRLTLAASPSSDDAEGRV